MAKHAWLLSEVSWPKRKEHVSKHVAYACVAWRGEEVLGLPRPGTRALDMDHFTFPADLTYPERHLAGALAGHWATSRHLYGTLLGLPVVN